MSLGVGEALKNDVVRAAASVGLMAVSLGLLRRGVGGGLGSLFLFRVLPSVSVLKLGGVASTFFCAARRSRKESLKLADATPQLLTVAFRFAELAATPPPLFFFVGVRNEEPQIMNHLLLTA